MRGNFKIYIFLVLEKSRLYFKIYNFLLEGFARGESTTFLQESPSLPSPSLQPSIHPSILLVSLQGKLTVNLQINQGW